MTLYTACSSKTLAEATALMKGDMNRAFTSGNTPIFPASSRGHVGIVKALIERGADVNLVNKKGDTPLLLACRRSHRGVIRALIEKGADVNHVGRNGESPLLLVSRNSRIEVIILLVQNGADVNYVDPQNGETALTIAVNRNEQNWSYYRRCNVRWLLENTSVDVNGGVDTTNVLNIALKRGQTSLAKLLLFHGADHTRADNQGHFPLYSALYNLESTTFFLDTFPDSVNHPITTEGTTTLKYILFGDAPVDVFKEVVIHRKLVDVGEKVEGKTAIEWYEQMRPYGDQYRHMKRIAPYLYNARDTQRLTELCKVFFLHDKQRASVVPHALKNTCLLSPDLFEELSEYMAAPHIVLKKSVCECGYC